MNYENDEPNSPNSLRSAHPPSLDGAIPRAS